MNPQPQTELEPRPELVIDVAGEVIRDRAMVDLALASALERHQGRIAGAAAHLVRAGGKRARPLLTCAVMRALGHEPAPRAREIISSELIHTASLLHDDLQDRATTRRGVTAVHRQFDARSAVMAGDLLMAEALELLSRAEEVALVRTAAGAVSAMSRGQVMEAEFSFTTSARLEDLARISQLKTASLIVMAAELGARLAGATPAQVEAAMGFGQGVGEAFQLIDDLLDWTGDAAETGKPVVQDLVEGKVTLPLRLAMDREPTLEAEVKRCWRAGPEEKGDLVAVVRRAVQSTGALDAARAVAAELVADALASLGRLPASIWTEHLAGIARRSLDRRA